jgi:hypothetical protein
MKNKFVSALLLVAALIGCGGQPATPADLSQMSARDRHAAIEDQMAGHADEPTRLMPTTPVVAIRQAEIMSSPYSAPAGTLAILGVNGNYLWLVWWRSTDSNCTFVQEGNFGSLLGDGTLTLNVWPAAWGDINILGPGQSKTIFCSGGPGVTPGNYTFTGTNNLQGSWFKVNGSPAGDYINASGNFTGTVYAYGNDGNDIIETSAPSNGLFYGGNGNDTFRNFGAPGLPTIGFDGSYGDDCIQTGGRGGPYFGGAGFDKISGYICQDACEQTITTNCP